MSEALLSCKYEDVFGECQGSMASWATGIAKYPQHHVNWTVTINNLGAFSLPPSIFPDEGNYRLRLGDSLRLIVPCGSLIYQEDVVLQVVNPLGECTKYTAVEDAIGNLVFYWKADDTPPGPCQFFFEYKPFEIDVGDCCFSKKCLSLINTVLVESNLRVGNVSLPAKALSVQTVPSCLLGKMDTWLEQLIASTSYQKYTLIHFTPVQTVGQSGSCYSIADHMKIDPALIPDFLQDKDDAEAWNYLKHLVNTLESNYGSLCACDLVLNHVADNCPWLADYPECGYNVVNSPYLQAAICLDVQLQAFASSVINNDFRAEGVTNEINNEEMLTRFMNLLEERVLKPFQLEEWFTFPFDRIMDDLKAMDISRSSFEYVFESLSDINEIVETIYEESLHTVGVKRNTGIWFNLAPLEGMVGDLTKVKALLDEVQKKLYETSASIYNSILQSIRSYVRWYCIEKHVVCSSAQMLIPRYFTPVVTPTKETIYLANNGDWDPEKSFIEAKYFIYLSRSLNVWSDCVKLRYGNSPSDVPFLWNYMEDYCQLSASIFSSLRLDNCHSTPIHVNEHFLRKCRTVNSQIWIFAELFSGKEYYDYNLERRVGINAFVREGAHCTSANHLAHLVEELSDRTIGSLSPYNSYQDHSNCEEFHYQTLVPTRATYVLYDCTHDNHVPNEIFTACHALPFTAALSMSNTVLGSTRGYDEIFPEHLNLSCERRLFPRYTYPLKKDCQQEKRKKNDPILRVMHGLQYSTVEVYGSWDDWKNPLSLSRIGNEWILDAPVVELLGSSVTYPEQTYQYKFLGDGQSWFVDPLCELTSVSLENSNNVLRTQLLKAPSEWKPKKPLPGIMEIRRVLNHLHETLICENFTECSTHVLQDRILLVQRHDATTHRFCLAYLHCAFSPNDLIAPTQTITHQFVGSLERVLLEAYLYVPSHIETPTSSQFLDGLPCASYFYDASPPRTDSLLKWFHTSYDSLTNVTTVTFNHFPPGTAFIFMTQGSPEVLESVQASFSALDVMFPQSLENFTLEKEHFLQALSYILFSCSEEENERSKKKQGCYVIPGVGELPYAGISSVVHLFDSIRYTQRKQRNHPLINNIKEGNWLVDYTINRLDSLRGHQYDEGVITNLWKISQWLRKIFHYPLVCLPRSMFAYYTDLILSTLYSFMAYRVTRMCFSEPLTGSREFISTLCLATLQFYSFIPSAAPKCNAKQCTLAAGLPHFAKDWQRCWGRDTFIAFKGCFLVMGRFLAAKQTLLCYAQVVRYGLIPNLLGSQSNPRYNARDVVWYFIQSVQDYCHFCPEKEEFLNTKIHLLDPLESHSSWVFQCFKHRPPPYDVISFSELLHYLLSSHVYGLKIREDNAGPTLDSYMKDEGFEISVSVNSTTGLVYGGNSLNCGTWMDKMGSSQQAGNIGIPASPRDGAAIEINGLVKSALRFINSLPKSIFPFELLYTDPDFTYASWEEKLQANFDTLYFIHPLRKNSYIHLSSFEENQRSNQDYAFHTGIYRDTLGCSEKGSDYKLRPNFFIAQAVAPELFSKDHFQISHETGTSILMPKMSLRVLQIQMNQFLLVHGRDAMTVLRNMKTLNLHLNITDQIGVKTLNPMDPAYNGYYDCSNQSLDPRVAHGYNYHNGPEWVWLLGYMLQSIYILETMDETDKACIKEGSNRHFLSKCMQYITKVREHILMDPWRSLPEFTNENGQFCSYSCPAQAWSVCTLLSFLHQVIKKGNTKHQSEQTQHQFKAHSEAT